MNSANDGSVEEGYSPEDGAGSVAELSRISRSALTAIAAARAFSRLSSEDESAAPAETSFGPKNLPTAQMPADRISSNAKAVLTPMTVRLRPSSIMAASNVKSYAPLVRDPSNCTTIPRHGIPACPR